MFVLSAEVLFTEMKKQLLTAALTLLAPRKSKVH